MFGLFSSKKTKLEKQYARLLEEAHRLSHSDRQASDLKLAEAEQVLAELKTLEKNTSPE